MKQNCINLFITMLMTVGCCADAGLLGKRAALELHVVDERNNPVELASVSMRFEVALGTRPAESRDGHTDSNGVFRAGGRTSGDVAGGVEKEGYYASHFDFDYSQPPWDHLTEWKNAVTVTLRRIINPVAMLGDEVREHPPVYDLDVGFDVMLGDWVQPHGTGIVSDIVVNTHWVRRGPGDVDYRTKVRFSNALDGLQEYSVAEGETMSEFVGPYEAPIAGYATTQLVGNCDARPGEVLTPCRDKRMWIVRLRTQVDEQGAVVSAIYGVLSGDALGFNYVINESGDRNVEADLKKTRWMNRRPY